jgi:Ca2+-binding RTX toxin-like protein
VLQAGNEGLFGSAGSLSPPVATIVGGDDTLSGAGGEDWMAGDVWQRAQLAGGSRIEGGDDLLNGGEGNDELFGDVGGSDAALVSGFIPIVGGNDTLIGGNGDDLLDGGGGNDQLAGNAGNDTLRGLAGRDTLSGGLGDDTIAGGVGVDVLAGSFGADVFDFNSVADSQPAPNRDAVTDFVRAQGDKIDLSSIDAIAGAGNDAFAFIGAAAFTNVAGQLRFTAANGNTVVSGDTDGDGAANLQILLTGITEVIAGDFVL